MVLSTEEYGFFYGTYKNEERQVFHWLESVAGPSPTGKSHAYSYHATLAKKVHSTGVTMPEVISAKLELAIIGRYRIYLDHQERGQYQDERHEYSIQMLTTIARLFMATEHAAQILRQLPTELRKVPVRSPSPKRGSPTTQRNVAGCWRQAGPELPSPPLCHQYPLAGPWYQPPPPPMAFAACAQPDLNVMAFNWASAFGNQAGVCYGMPQPEPGTDYLDLQDATYDELTDLRIMMVATGGQFY